MNVTGIADFVIHPNNGNWQLTAQDPNYLLHQVAKDFAAHLTFSMPNFQKSIHLKKFI
jgi:hypothetical protein